MPQLRLHGLDARALGDEKAGARRTKVLEPQPFRQRGRTPVLGQLGSRVVVVGRLQQRTWTDQDGSARQVVEVVAEELGPSLRWATATMTRATRSQDQ